MRRQVFLFIITASVFFLGCQTHIPSVPGESEALLRQYAYPIDLENKDLILPEQMTSENRIFLFGEAHGVAESPQVDLYLLALLHEQAGVRYYLSEQGFSASMLVNEYLDTGDESFLDHLFSQLEGTYSWTRELRRFYIDLRAWNLGLPESERVRFVGVDVEHQHRTAWRYIAGLLPETPAPAEIGLIVHGIKEYVTGPMDDGGAQYDLARNTAESIETYSSVWRNWLLEDFFFIDLTVKNLVVRNILYENHDSMDFVDWGNMRDQRIFENFLAVDSRFGQPAFYGRWGAVHVRKYRYLNIDYWAARAHNAGYSIYSIESIYNDSVSMRKRPYREEELDFPENSTTPLENSTTEKITFFHLPTEFQDFYTAPYFIDDPEAIGGTLDYFDGILFIQGARPMHPLE
ncbi:MAG: hypothetical protein ACLFR1_12370 [Spirochaetia bacterium]